MTDHVRIAAAGNVEVPAYLVLVGLGFQVQRKQISADEVWTAKRDHEEFAASGPIELLGVVAVFENRGREWKATDSQIDEFMQLYYPSKHP